MEATCEEGSVGMVAQLRLLADMLENHQLEIAGGGIVTNTDQTGTIRVNSNVLFKQKPHLKVVQVEMESIVLYEPTQIEVYGLLDKMNPGEVNQLHFDYDDLVRFYDWQRIVKNRGDYPEYLISRVFTIQVFRGTDGCDMLITRVQ